MSNASRKPATPTIRCDDCGLEVLVGAPVEQPSFHVFTDGVLCDDCYRRALDRDHDR